MLANKMASLWCFIGTPQEVGNPCRRTTNTLTIIIMYVQYYVPFLIIMMDTA